MSLSTDIVVIPTAASEPGRLRLAVPNKGRLQQPTLEKPRPYSGMHWRYTIPGNGCAPWPP